MKKIIDTIKSFLKARDWLFKLHPNDIAKGISIESAELLELFQWGRPSLEEIKANPELMQRIKEELADVMIYSLDLAIILDFDPEEIVLQKIKMNGEKYPVQNK